MKLRNKKTGEIVRVEFLNNWQTDDGTEIGFRECKTNIVYSYDSLAELNEKWEDYEEQKEYWYIDPEGTIICEPDDEAPYDNYRKQIGNYFETKEEAEKAVEKLKAWKRLKDKGISFEVKVIDRKWYLEPKAEPQQRSFDEAHDLFKDVMFIFGGENDIN